MILEHYTEEPFRLRPTQIYLQRRPYSHRKPQGLWVSVKGEDDWPNWCWGEEFCLEGLAYCQVIKLRPCATILHLSTGAQLEEFHHVYAVETEFEARARDWASPGFVHSQWPIDWVKVAAEFDGIIIAPYQYEHRLLGPHWYYGWDCASGCLWNLNAIASVTPIEPFPVKVLDRSGSR